MKTAVAKSTKPRVAKKAAVPTYMLCSKAVPMSEKEVVDWKAANIVSPKPVVAYVKPTSKVTKKPTQARKQYAQNLIKLGTHTAQEIVSLLKIEFPMYKPVSHQTLITDSKNTKYNCFKQLVVQNKQNKLLSFAA